MKQNKTAEELKSSFEEIHEKNPNRIPIILEKNRDSVSLQSVKRNKFLIPGNLTISQFQYIIRGRIKLKPEEAMFLFTDSNTLVTGSTLISQVYKEIGRASCRERVY
jgi:hypothetical protein